VQAHAKYRLEPLEPRVLLSADPLAVVLNGQLLTNAENGEANTLVQQLDAGSDADAGTFDSGSQAGQSTQENLSVAWPESWQAGSTGDAQNAAAEAVAGDTETWRWRSECPIPRTCKPPSLSR